MTVREKKASKKSEKVKAKEKKENIKAKAKEDSKAMEEKRKADKRVMDNIWGLVLIAIGIFIFVSIQFGATGKLGDMLDSCLKGLFGLIAYVFPWFLVVIGVCLIGKKTRHFDGRSLVLILLMIASVCAINSGRFIKTGAMDFDLGYFYTSGGDLASGGLVGMSLALGLIKASGRAGLYIFASLILVICTMLFFNTPLSRAFETIGLKMRERRLVKERLEEARQEEVETAKADFEESKKKNLAKAEAARKSKKESSLKFDFGEDIQRAESTTSTVSVTSKPEINLFDDNIESSSSSDDYLNPNGFDLDRALEPAPKSYSQQIAKPEPVGKLGRDSYEPKNSKGGFFDFFRKADSNENNGHDNGFENKLNVDLGAENPSSYQIGGYEPAVEDSTLGSSDTRPKFGLEEKKEVREGYGLDGKSLPKAGFGLGAERSEGIGLGLEPSRESGTSFRLGQKDSTSAGYGLEPSHKSYSKGTGISGFTDHALAKGLGSEAGMDVAGAIAGSTLATKITSKKDSGIEDSIEDKNRISLDKASQLMSEREMKEEGLKKLGGGENVPLASYTMPPISLLKLPTKKKEGNLQRMLESKARKLEETLQNFNVDAHVVNVTQGPAVTRYEIHPNVGVKVKSIVALADDIALNLEAKSIRIEAPIPGKAAVGIEVENDNIKMVSLREIIGSENFEKAESKITVAVGRDISGRAIVTDLKSMPHLLIAGATGSGKSVCINSIITSLLYKARPEEVKLVLIDPKVVELGNYNGIPHLLIPVVTEPSKAAAALNWAVAEMNDRYKKFADSQVRDLASFNSFMRKEGREEDVMPEIVIIIDELADLMMAAPSQVEESICRLAQMARAAGMHLIVATQRPSVDIITGVIKANIPSRIAFAVSSQFDSRTILGMNGAEKLVGKGDMLFNPVGMGKPLRVQGTFVSDSEVNAVIDFVKSQVPAVEYASHVMETIDKGPSLEEDDDGDEFLQEAIECVVEAGQASVSMLQRRFRIGYNRAARIVDMMEMRGIVGPQDGSRPRQVLLSKEELEEMKAQVMN